MSSNLILDSDGNNSSDSNEDDELTFSFSGKRSSKDNNDRTKNKDVTVVEGNIISVGGIGGDDFVDAPIDYYDTKTSVSIYDVPLSLQVSRMSGTLPPDDITENMNKLNINSKK